MSLEFTGNALREVTRSPNAYIHTNHCVYSGAPEPDDPTSSSVVRMARAQELVEREKLFSVKDTIKTKYMDDLTNQIIIFDFLPLLLSASPQCALQDQEGHHYCILICQPGENGNLRAGDDQCGEATCQPVQGTGVCTYAL